MSSCAWGKFGKLEGNAFNLNKPSGLKGQDKASVMDIIGDPDFVLSEGKTEYWGYRNHNGWHIIAIGMTESKDLILEFRGNKVETAYLIHKGSTLNIIVPPPL